ncbi:hypothetical protein J8273_5063 [Carpediemonas membranifera]|uniref:Uncharacterized protein n=1 Tax=Carpediemonas membranifera TaxID=201153 RepID=A0A8J6BXK4_9EUKA|nr:hypothetical protein J8273_5063 [Carpediemonas membranifera]|eukprot:KAG9393576.1 hypothetical protein J8273_5063 [Carpediemonas membranifera]
MSEGERQPRTERTRARGRSSRPVTYGSQLRDEVGAISNRPPVITLDIQDEHRNEIHWTEPDNSVLRPQRTITHDEKGMETGISMASLLSLMLLHTTALVGGLFGLLLLLLPIIHFDLLKYPAFLNTTPVMLTSTTALPFALAALAFMAASVRSLVARMVFQAADRAGRVELANVQAAHFHRVFPAVQMGVFGAVVIANLVQTPLDTLVAKNLDSTAVVTVWFIGYVIRACMGVVAGLTCVHALVPRPVTPLTLRTFNGVVKPDNSDLIGVFFDVVERQERPRTPVHRDFAMAAVGRPTAELPTFG